MAFLKAFNRDVEIVSHPRPRGQAGEHAHTTFKLVPNADTYFRVV